MKRSEINRLIRENEQFIAGMGFHLPPFAGYTPEEWREKDYSYDEIRERMLGWDVTDYGKGDFHKIGLFLFTLRNGTFGDPHCPKTYAEKLLYIKEGQYSPMRINMRPCISIFSKPRTSSIGAAEIWWWSCIRARRRRSWTGCPM